MELFIDSADLSLVEKYFSLRIFKGVTTTPTFFFRQGISDPRGEIKKIIEATAGDVHVEATGLDANEIIDSAKQNASMHPQVVSKIPMSAEGIKAVKQLAGSGTRTNMHLIFSLNQAVLAAEAGAEYVCPLIGRLNDIGEDALKITADIVSVLKKYGYKTRIMASSIRSTRDVAESFSCGVDAITIPPQIIDTMIFHPLTERGIEAFERDMILSGTVDCVMKTGNDMPVIRESDPLLEALGVMTEKGIGLCIITDGKRLKGIITDGDIRRLIKGRGNALDRKVGDVMNASPVTIGPDCQVQDALKLMEQKRITVLVVVSAGCEPVGYINLHDVLARVD